MTGGAFTDGTPLPCPYDAAAVTLGQERLARLRDTVERDVGLENLAFAFSREDCELQPRFVEELLAPVDGFLLLDVHNLYCQADNYGFDPIELMERYPLHRVRELHVAGGQLTHPASDPAGRSFRRDGHDRPVPDGAFALVEAALSRCPDLEVIILEHADHTLSTASALDRFATDFRHLRRLVADAGRALPADDV